MRNSDSKAPQRTGGRRWAPPLLAALCLAACGGPEISTAEAQAAAKERVRADLGLAPESALFTNIFVGEEVDGAPTLCGTVSGTTADGAEVQPRRFIVSLDDGKWLKFGPADDDILPSKPDIFPEWHKTCLSEQAAR